MEKDISDFQVDWKERKSVLAYRKKQLPIPPDGRHVLKEETLLELPPMDIEKENRGYISGRHHNYKGEEKLYALKALPETHKVLFPRCDPSFPEDNLMPNEEYIRKVSCKS